VRKASRGSRALWIGPLALACACEKQGTTPPGDLNRFDAIAALPEVTAYAAPGAQLLSIEARHVKSDGTLDLEAPYEPVVLYRFVGQLLPEGRSEPGHPLGAQPPASPANTHVLVRVERPHRRVVGQDVGPGRGSHFVYRRGMLRFETRRDEYDVVPPPSCSFVGLWEQARDRGVPPEAVARICYDRRGYVFSIEGTDHAIHFDAGCRPIAPEELPEGEPCGQLWHIYSG
jgi:hypothetical protein